MLCCILVADALRRGILRDNNDTRLFCLYHMNKMIIRKDWARGYSFFISCVLVIDDVLCNVMQYTLVHFGGRCTPPRYLKEQQCHEIVLPLSYE